jgi:hypothetical protein
MPAHQGRPIRARNDVRMRSFIHDSFVRSFPAAPRELTGEGRAPKPQDFRCDSGDHTTWSRPVDRLAGYWP